MRAYVVVLLTLAGCKYIDQPKKVAALEKRLDEVAERVAELSGEPIDGEDADEETAADARGKRGARGAKGDKAARGDRAAKGARADKAAKGRDARPSRTAKPGRDDDGEGDDRAAGDDERKPSRDRAADRRRAGRGDAAEDDAERAGEGERPAPAPAAEPPAPIALEPTVDVPWGYEGASGPEAWGSLDPSFATCADGAAQSPIDILPRRSEAPEAIFVYKPAAATAVDDGHGLALELEQGGFIVVDGTRYDLVRLQVHTPAEHTIAGDSFPMELQLVHRSKAGGVAIVAVLYGEGEASTALAPLWKGAPRGRGRARLKKPFDVDALLPKDRSAYRYDGSLTTPPCSEGVIWHVLRRPRSDDERVLAAIRHRLGASARPLQELGERTVR